MEVHVAKDLTPEQIKAARDREVEGQKQTDAAWRKASEGVMKMEKITYKSTAKDGMAIPAFVFTPSAIALMKFNAPFSGWSRAANTTKRSRAGPGRKRSTSVKLSITVARAASWGESARRFAASSALHATRAVARRAAHRTAMCLTLP